MTEPDAKLQPSTEKLVKDLLAGKLIALSKLLTLVECEDPQVSEIEKLIFPSLGRAYRIGVTGPPGAGKSTLTDQLTSTIRKKGLTVGIIAVDPSSPFSGGAVLGDRCRMLDHSPDDGVFIRSMATRGFHGGLPKTVGAAIQLFDAYGTDVIIIETVGVGQTELSIMENADSVLLVLVPEGGDSVQTIKAGIMEIADIFIVNKADRPGAHEMSGSIQSADHIKRTKAWNPPVLLTEAANGVGIEELYETIEKHRGIITKNGELAKKRKEQRRRELVTVIEQKFIQEMVETINTDPKMAKYLKKLDDGTQSPSAIAEEILDKHVFRSAME